ncbi:MAG: NACHT domain-containing protein, partial [SAR324 cluster bacterium]|nr:NACHT domain-containing protein [SAR324 cluster bacterium]
MTLEVMDLTKVSNTFPRLPKTAVRRDGMINGMNHYLQNVDIDYLIVEGINGIGKTTTVAQFASDYSFQAFTLFISPYSSWGFDPNILFRDLERQINWILFKTLDESESFLDKGSLHRSYSSLLNYAKKYNKVFYFIIDGLDEVPEIHQDVTNSILELLPGSNSFFKFIITSKDGNLSSKRFTSTNIKRLPIVPFSVQEAKELFGGLIDDDFLIEINNTCNGLPEYLVTIRRLIENGLTRESFSIDLPKKMPELFSLEWEKIDYTDTIITDILSIITFAKNQQSINTLGQIMGLDARTISSIVNRISFVNLTEDGTVSFVSESFKNFASTKLRVYKNRAIDKLIDHYMANILSVESVLSLPNYLQEAEKFDELLAHLTPQNMTRVIDTGASVFPIKHHISLGIEASKRSSKNVEMMRFCSQKSVVNSIDKSKSQISEIEALISLQLEDQALDLAQSTLFKEDLLHSLAIIAKYRVLNDKEVGSELLDQMRILYSQIDPLLIGTKGIDIASDLLFSLPDLAIEMADKIINSNNSTGEQDWRIARLSLNAIRMDKQLGSKVFEQVNKTIGQGSSEKLSVHASLLLGDYDAPQIIQKASEFSDPLNSLSLLRLWILQKREREDVTDVMKYVLERSIQTTVYTPNAYDYRQIASPLPFLSSEEEIRDLVPRFDDLRTTLQKTGPSVEHVRLQLLIRDSEKKIGIKSADDRILELYLYYVHGMLDIPTKATCLARILESLLDSEDQLRSEENDVLISTIRKDFFESIETIITNVAEQYDVTVPVIAALSRKFPSFALDFIERLNTENRRNSAKYDLLETYIGQPVQRWDSTIITSIIHAIGDRSIRENAIELLFNRLSAQHPIDKFVRNYDFSYIHEILDQVQNPLLLCKCHLDFLTLCLRLNSEPEDESKFNLEDRKIVGTICQIESVWRNLDASWEKFHLGFSIASTLSDFSKDKAIEFYQITKEQKQTFEFNDVSLSSVYSTCVRLAIRAFSGLLKRRIENEADQQLICNAISVIEDPQIRMYLWASIVSCYYINNRTDDAKQVFSKYIHPYMLQLERNNPTIWSSTFLNIVPAFYVTNPVTTFEEIQKLDVGDQDVALLKVAHFICERSILSDPYYYGPGSKFDLTYEQIIDLINLANRMRNDSALYSLISTIPDNFSGSSRRTKFTREQRNEIQRRIRDIINEKLPDMKNIQHKGYEIIALSEVLRIESTGLSDYLHLEELANEIPNTSDRAYVLGIIASNMPEKHNKERIRIINSLSSDIEKIPSNLDRIERYLAAAGHACSVDISVSKMFIQKALENSILLEGTTSHNIQREIVDLAYSSVGPDYAKGLIEQMDDDPAREEAKRNMQDAFQLREMKNQIGNPRERVKIQSNSESLLPKICWKMLSELNARRILTRNIDDYNYLLEFASNVDILDSYPI